MHAMHALGAVIAVQDCHSTPVPYCMQASSARTLPVEWLARPVPRMASGIVHARQSKSGHGVHAPVATAFVAVGATGAASAVGGLPSRTGT